MRVFMLEPSDEDKLIVKAWTYKNTQVFFQSPTKKHLNLIHWKKFGDMQPSYL